MDKGCPATVATNYIIIGCVLGLLIIASIVYCVARRNAEKQKQAAPDVVSEVAREETRDSVFEPPLDVVDCDMKASQIDDQRATLLTRDTFFNSIR